MMESKVFADNFSRSFSESGDFFQLLNTTTLILKNEEDRLCLIGRLEMLR